MTGARDGPAPTDAMAPLAATLDVLASSARLTMLHLLRDPRPLAAIQVATPHGRAMTRQSVQKHLDRLLDAGLVEAIEQSQGGPVRRLYQARPGAVFLATQNLGRLGAHLPGPVAEETTTMPAGLPIGRRRSAGTRLLMTRGTDEGRAFPLARRLAGSDGWRIGRSADCAVQVRDDPAVSRYHARISRDVSGRYMVHQVSPRNPITVDWQPVADVARIRSGAVLGIGHSQLVFRTS